MFIQFLSLYNFWIGKQNLFFAKLKVSFICLRLAKKKRKKKDEISGWYFHFIINLCLSLRNKMKWNEMKESPLTNKKSNQKKGFIFFFNLHFDFQMQCIYYTTKWKKNWNELNCWCCSSYSKNQSYIYISFQAHIYIQDKN